MESAFSCLQIEDLSAELEALGGGSARVSQYRVVAVCGTRVPPSAPGGPTPKGSAACDSVVRLDGQAVCVRDPRAPADAAAAQSMRKYSIPTFVSAAADPQGKAFNTVAAEVRPVCYLQLHPSIQERRSTCLAVLVEERKMPELNKTCAMSTVHACPLLRGRQTFRRLASVRP